MGHRMRRRAAGDAGSALVLALVFLSLFGLFISVLLSFTSTSLRVTGAVRSEGDASLAADGSVEAAIANLRGNTAWGTATGTCPEFQTVVNGRTATVACEAAPGSGAVTPGNTTTNTPQYAVLALGAAGEDGIAQNKNSRVSFGGPIFANGTINASHNQAVISVDGAATGHSCPGPGQVSATPLACSSSATQTDPGIGTAAYDPLVGTPPAVVSTLPSCASGTATLSPGTYQSASSLTTLAAGCDRMVFTPGVYYFEFPDGAGAWTVSNKDLRIVGGTLDATGACDDTGPGVQWIFGGQSRIDVQKGALELCASPSATAQQIAVYGVRPVAPTPLTAIVPTAVQAQGSFGASASGAMATDAIVASTTVDTVTAGSNPSQTTPLSLQTFSNPMPAGSTINGVTLQITHSEAVETGRNADSLANLTLEARVGTSGAWTTVRASGATKCTTLCTDSVALSGITTVAGVTGVIAQYRATIAGNNATNRGALVSVDSMVLDVTYTPPGGLKGQSGCIVTVGAGACAVLQTGGNEAQLSVKGTIYTPAAWVHVDLVNTATAIVTRGAIVRSLTMILNPSVDVVPAFDLPSTGGSATADRRVLLTATVDGQVRLRALVAFDDSSPGHTPDVQSWMVVR
jgi:hypothetical protein